MHIYLPIKTYLFSLITSYEIISKLLLFIDINYWMMDFLYRYEYINIVDFYSVIGYLLC